MLAVKTYSAPRSEPRTRRRTRVVATARPGKVLVGYSAVEKLNRGEARDLETDLETIDTAKGLAHNLRVAGFDADTYIVHTLDDVDRVAENFDLNELLFFNLCEHLNGVATDDVKITTRMDKLGIHYTGAPTAALKRCLDKARTKHVLALNDVSTAPYQVFTRAEQTNRDRAARQEEARQRIGTATGDAARQQAFERYAAEAFFVPAENVRFEICGHQAASGENRRGGGYSPPRGRSRWFRRRRSAR